MTATYLHGYSVKEQRRLYEQAEFLEQFVYEDIDLRKVKFLLEVGCGVGAQTRILLKRFPHLNIMGVDLSREQIDQAKNYLKKEISKRKVILEVQDAQKLSLDCKYDGAFLMWFLEHVPSPITVLKQVRKHLKKGALIYCTEVQNASFFLEPYSPAT